MERLFIRKLLDRNVIRLQLISTVAAVMLQRRQKSTTKVTSYDGFVLLKLKLFSENPSWLI